MKPVTITRENWWPVVEAARNRSGIDELPIWVCLSVYYNICVPSLITPISASLWQLYRRIGGTKNETYCSLMKLPAFWVHACDVIDTEINRIEKAREDEAKTKFDSFTKRK